MITLKQNLRNYLLVTILEKEGELRHRRTSCRIWVQEECSGWDFPYSYLCDTCFKMAQLPKIVHINKIQNWIPFVPETTIFVVYFDSLWQFCDVCCIHRSGNGNVEFDNVPVGFCSALAVLFNLFCWHVSEQDYCALELGVS